MVEYLDIGLLSETAHHGYLVNIYPLHPWS
jgi:hypothetical protein